MSWEGMEGEEVRVVVEGCGDGFAGAGDGEWVLGLEVAEGAVRGADDGVVEAVVFPVEVDGEASAGEESGGVSGVPGVGECGEEGEDVAGWLGVGGWEGAVALEEHFGDGGGGAEVAVDLEGRVCGEEVGVDAAAGEGDGVAGRGGSEEHPDEPFGVVAVEESCLEAGFPGE